jgi:hypothetical protein
MQKQSQQEKIALDLLRRWQSMLKKSAGFNGLKAQIVFLCTN